jgi:hypothetical protein
MCFSPLAKRARLTRDTRKRAGGRDPTRALRACSSANAALRGRPQRVACGGNAQLAAYCVKRNMQPIGCTAAAHHFAASFALRGHPSTGTSDVQNARALATVGENYRRPSRCDGRSIASGTRAFRTSETHAPTGRPAPARPAPGPSRREHEGVHREQRPVRHGTARPYHVPRSRFSCVDRTAPVPAHCVGPRPAARLEPLRETPTRREHPLLDL